MRSATLWIAIIFCYPIIFIVSSILSFFVKIPSATISENQLVKILNKWFAEYGYILFTLSYFAFTVQKSGHYLIIRTAEVPQSFRKYLLITVCAIIFNVWFFGFLLFERIDELAGGHCAVSDSPSEKLPQRQCLNAGFEWISRFDLSGHFYILTSMSLALGYQLLSCLYGRNISTITDFFRGVSKVHEMDSGISAGTFKAVYKAKVGEVFSQSVVATVRIFSLFLISVWTIVFAITGIFFHTFWEKAILLALSLGLSIMILGNLQEEWNTAAEH